MIRAALYARYSTDKRREASIEDQARNCRRVAEREGWRLDKPYQDQAVSGCRTDRPGYQSMLADAKAGQFDVLLVDDISPPGTLGRARDWCLGWLRFRGEDPQGSPRCQEPDE